MKCRAAGSFHPKVVILKEPNFSRRRYFEGETTEIPKFFVARVRQDLGPLWQWLPSGAMYHDTNAYRASENEKAPARGTVTAPSA